MLGIIAQSNAGNRYDINNARSSLFVICFDHSVGYETAVYVSCNFFLSDQLHFTGTTSQVRINGSVI